MTEEALQRTHAELAHISPWRPAQSYRVKFDKVIRGSSYETLVDLMKARAG